MDRIRLNASEWMDFRSGEKKCFLLTNGLGGYCSLTVMGNAARNDQALLMGALKAPTVREHLISNVWETLEVDGEETELFSQEFVNRTQNVEGFRFLEGFEMGSLPVWFYRVKGIEIEKTIGMVQGENTVLVRYRVRSVSSGFTPVFLPGLDRLPLLVIVSGIGGGSLPAKHGAGKHGGLLCFGNAILHIAVVCKLSVLLSVRS